MYVLCNYLCDLYYKIDTKIGINYNEIRQFVTKRVIRKRIDKRGPQFLKVFHQGIRVDLYYS